VSPAVEQHLKEQGAHIVALEHLVTLALALLSGEKRDLMEANLRLCRIRAQDLARAGSDNLALHKIVALLEEALDPAIGSAPAVRPTEAD
jgi:hypothetical protein